MTCVKFVTTLPSCVCRLENSMHIIQCMKGAPRATISSEGAFKGPTGKYSFEVLMKDKKVKTAIGFLSKRKTEEYMRDTPIGETHVSFGGAGWIHPKEIAASKKYTEGDRVKAEVDFSESVVKFYVNSEYAGQDEWKEPSAYPAVSVDGGPCTLEITVIE